MTRYCEMDQIASNRIQLDLIGSKETKLDQVGSNQIILVQISSYQFLDIPWMKKTKLDQIMINISAKNLGGGGPCPYPLSF